MLPLLVALLGVNVAQAQLQVTGSVVAAEDNAPLPGVNIVEVGTTRGASTDFDGRFSFIASGPDVTLAVSFVGYVTQYIDLNGRTQLTIELEEDVALLEEVVVTAFGVERQQRAVGYSVAEVGGESLRQARETNVANALAGKIAGVVVSKPATGPAGSSRVIIRGNTSLEGNNQPLYVVDGVPIDNRNQGNAGMWGGADLGDGISSINPDDIDNISVLKGPAAAALYGTRAQNGVILITTKKGVRPGAGVGVEYSAELTFENALVNLTDFQEQYGQGTRGAKPANQSEALETGNTSWGARLDGSNVVQFDGVARPYSLVDDKLGRFYDTGLTNTNTLSLTGQVQNTAVRASFSRMNSEAIVPTSGVERYTMSLRGTSKFGERLDTDVKINYIREEADNRSRLSDSPGNPNWSVRMLPANVNPEDLAPGYCTGDPDTNDIVCPQGEDVNAEQRYRQDVFAQNPYWAAEKFTNDDTKNRIIGHALLRYELADWISIQGRVGQDWYQWRYKSVTPYGTAYRPTGDMNETNRTIMERNFDFLINLNRDVTEDLGVNATLGGNKMRQEYESIALSGSAFSIPGLETISNAANQSNGFDVSTKEINSVYGSAEFSYRNFAFLTTTARNDWSSTLPLGSNSYFYPSVSASFVFSDALQVPEWLTFGKIRGSWAEVGGDTDPYRLNLTYRLQSFTHQGQPIGLVAQNEIPLSTLKPSSHQGWEVGFDTRFFDNRIGLDFTYYKSNTKNQILATAVPNSTGFGSRVINAGNMENKGIELLVSGTPIRTPDVRWNVDVNFAKNENTVIELFGDPACALPLPPEGRTQGIGSVYRDPDLDCSSALTVLGLGSARGAGAAINARVGDPYGTIVGATYLRDENGNIILDENALPVVGPTEILGNGNPDWTMGISNTVRWKNLTLNTLIDISWGGEIFSGTNAQAYSLGLHQNTLEGRAACEQAGYDANGGTGCWVPDGVVFADGIPRDVDDEDIDGDFDEVIGTGEANTTATFPQSYWGRIGGSITEEFVYDASFVKLRQVQLSYRLPTRLIRNTPFQIVTISLVGRNLWNIHTKTPNIDPETNYANDNAQGLEWAGVPQTRSFGFNVNFRL
jgi:TonB-linked SusC/RagA family outer membrane protein